MSITFFDIQDVVHFEFIPQVQTVNRNYQVEILKRLHETVRRESLTFSAITRFSTMTKLQITSRSLSSTLWSKNRLVKWNTTHRISLIVSEWFLDIYKKTVCLNGINILGFWKYPKCEDGTERCYTTEITKMFLTVAASLG